MISEQSTPHLPNFEKKMFVDFLKRGGHIGRSYQPILLIVNSKHRKTTRYLVPNLDEYRTKNATARAGCCIEKVQNGRHDVFDLEISNTE